jgi:hypothetical protein
VGPMECPLSLTLSPAGQDTCLFMTFKPALFFPGAHSCG